eukprot:Gb_26313 [translate_table: standard]
MAMAALSAQSLWNRNKRKMVLLLLSNGTFYSTLYSDTNTKTNDTQCEKPHGNANANNAICGISENVKMLCKQGRLKEALNILHLMDQRGIPPDFYAYASLLQSCVNVKTLPEGKLVHAHMIEIGFEPYIFLEAKLVILYAKCESLVDARRVFDQMPHQNVVSWNAIIAAYARHGKGGEALTLFYQMEGTGFQPDEFTFASVLPACAGLAALEHGKIIHEDIIRRGYQFDIFVGSALVDMYTKCGSIENARHVFDKMPRLGVVTWSAMIAGYTQNGYNVEALKLFRQMQLAGVEPDKFTFASVLPACGSLAALDYGRNVHEEIILSGSMSDIFVENALLDMYAKCGSMEDARTVFDNMPERDVVSWTALISGYAQNGLFYEALELFEKMPQRNVVSWTVMIAGYAQHGQVDEALKLFQKIPVKDVISWTAIIAGYVQNGCYDEALKLFQEMQLQGVKPSSGTFASVLPACANLAALHEGKELHEDIIKSGFQYDIFVGNALVDMYAKCQRIEDAQKVFQEMPRRDLVSWNSMIAGYTQNGYFTEALKLFQQMQLMCVKPNPDAFASVLSACANLAALHEGKKIHEGIVSCGFHSDVFVGSALIDMYAKCGSIDDARNVFDNMLKQDVVLWNAMIVGYATHGCGKEALQLFEQMQHLDTKPNLVTFVGVLTACCHAGLVDDGCQYFDAMSQDYHIVPAMKHYCCMVDLLGRAGRLDEALNFINKMPIQPDATVWGTLLGACTIHINIELGEHVAEQLFESDPRNAAHYVALSNIYAAAGRWDGVEKVRKMMKDRKVVKMPGCSWIEMKKVGYLPNNSFMLRDVEEEQKKQILFHHSEKLAIAFGLINTSPGILIHIVKNLQVCGD